MMFPLHASSADPLEVIVTDNLQRLEVLVRQAIQDFEYENPGVDLGLIVFTAIESVRREVLSIKQTRSDRDAGLLD